MKHNWKTIKLSEVCDIGAGNSAPQKKEFFIDGIYPFFRTSDVGQIHIGSITESTDYLNEKGIKGLKLFNKGTILLPKSGASTFLNHRVVLGIAGYVSSHLATVKTDEKVLNNNYLFYFLQEVKAQNLIQDHKYPSLNLPVIGNIKISYPESLPEQHRIVKILDEVFENIKKAKENAEKNLQNATELFESYLQNVFVNPGKDWEEKSLEELGKITSSKRIYKKEYAKNGIPFYRIKEIKELAHNKNITLELYISPKRYKEIKDIFGVPLVGDILMTAVGTIGEIYVVKNDDEFYFKDGNILWFKNFNSVDPYFLKFVLMSFVKQINKLSKGSAYNALTIEKIEKHRIFIPKSISEQKSIVIKLETLSAETTKLETIYEKKLADLEELKKSVLKKAFEGEF